MTEATEDSIDLDDPHSWEKARAVLRAKKIGSGPKTRQKREKKIRATVDGRSLAVSGRVKQFNFKALEQVHTAVSEAAAFEGITIAEWMEKTLIQVLNIDIRI
jgi:hypothetical protein